MRKSKIYLIIAILCLLMIVCNCFVFNLPKFWFTVITIFGIILGFTSYALYCIKQNSEYVDTSDEHIDELRKEYNYINQVVHIYTQLIYNGLSDEFVKKYLLKICDDDAYLLDFEYNIQAFKNKSNLKEIKNEFISVACLMDSLISKSAWKIASSYPNEIVFLEDLVWINCSLSVCVALSLCDLSYEDLKHNLYLERLTELLVTCSMDDDSGSTTIIEFEALILELLYNEFSKIETNDSNDLSNSND